MSAASSGVEVSPVAGKRMLVTGAASGIGLAIARHMGERGAQVVLSDLPGDRLDAATAVIEGSRCVGADLSQRSDVHRLADEAGEVDIVVNNAGLQHVSPIEDFDEAKWDLIRSVMLDAPFVLIKRLLPGMYARGHGRIINIASVHGLIASPYKAAYVAAKHGVVGLTKTVALEAGEKGVDVTVNAICPSYVRTPLVEGQVADQARAHGIPESEVLEKVLLTRNAVKRLIEPEEVAATVEFLCSPSAWSITGTTLTMDAGWLAH
ncbi:MAG TPA: 3-hydroxybutyrate dehydrogenase [Candidatus Dormibacteraeota bacterium]|jgi:3-hydroxybutyrate dehydrogenase|nr:3-hydroxybutyrate dehydrogenase [Candidatus Dormibacteraeota bacterium]